MIHLKFPIIFRILSILLLFHSFPNIVSPHEESFNSQWSSSDPKTIPYHERLEQLKKGNLVTNPSFEHEREDERSGTGLVPDGWEIIGDNVAWIDASSDPEAEIEVKHGSRAVKIEKINASETDAADGIISDFIPVIPGNYYFAYDVRLKNIHSARYRHGLRLFDTISIKLLFFDNQKNPIGSKYPGPGDETLFDNSDKGHPFANYWSIEKFPWGTVRGRTYHYPFSEGDIPDQTRFIRLFFGVKGSGTVWLDNIDFRYSKWNFTPLERMRSYFNRPLSIKDRLIPQPKKFRKINEFTYLDPSKPDRSMLVILLPENPAPADRTAAELLQQRLTAVINKIMPFQNPRGLIHRLGEDFGLADALNAKLVFSIGKTELYRKMQPDLPLDLINGKNQGYVISSQYVDDRLVVFLLGNFPIGNYYAATTAAQLLEDDNGIYHNAAVIDYPDFLGRSYLMKGWRDEKEMEHDRKSVQRMSRFKLNKAYIGNLRSAAKWFQPSVVYTKGVAAVGRTCLASGVMDMAVMVNPYSHFPFAGSEEKLSEKLRNTWTHSDPASFDLLQDVFRIGLDAGAKTVMLLSDDYVPHTGPNPVNYGLYTQEDRDRFVNLQNAQAHIINGLKQWIDREYPDTRFEFCPPWYTNEFMDQSHGAAEVYFKELIDQIPTDIAIIWTGPTVRSLSIDKADLHRIKSLLGRWPMIWDNTLYARNIESKRYGGYAVHYPGKVKMCNLFEPYDIYKPDNFHLYSDSQHIYINGISSSEIYRIKYATVADYLWNTAAYDPERSLWKIMFRSYGKAGARALLLFNDIFYDLNSICLYMELEGVEEERIRKGQTLLKGLDYTLRRIVDIMPSKTTLLEELKRHRNRQMKRLQELSGGR